MNPVPLAALILVALVFNFLNGLHDSANIVATVISSRALPARAALWLTALAEFSGPFVLGLAVATTIGQGLVAPGTLTLATLLAGSSAMANRRAPSPTSTTWRR